MKTTKLENIAKSCDLKIIRKAKKDLGLFCEALEDSNEICRLCKVLIIDLSTPDFLVGPEGLLAENFPGSTEDSDA